MARVVVPVPWSDYVIPSGGYGYSLAGVRLSYSRDFDTAIENPSARIRELARAFGLGLDSKKLTIYPKIELELNPGDIIYVTGESGGGKSLLLRFLAEELNKHGEFSPVATSWDTEKRIKRDKPVIETVGKDTTEAISILSSAGLTDTYSWLRRYNELSEGQRYRYLFALTLSKKAKTVILDEFCSTLDRETAKATAYTVQRYARKKGLTLIVGTALNDLEHDLNPNLVITKHLGPHIHVRRRRTKPVACSLVDNITIVEGSIDDWRLLSFLHYRSQNLGGASKVFKADLNGRTIGVVVYSIPYFPAPGFAECFNTSWYMRERFRNVLRISRVVIHPSFRGVGLSGKLLLESMPKLGKPFVEIISTMQLYHNFTKSYMTTVKVVRNEKKEKTLQNMKNETGIDPELPLTEIAKQLSSGGAVKKLAKWIRENYHIFLNLGEKGRLRLDNKQQLLTALARIKSSTAPKVYAVWVNPSGEYRDVREKALRKEFRERLGFA